MNKKTEEMEKKNIGIIDSEFVNIKQSSVRSVEAGHVELQQVGVLTADGERIDVTQGAFGLVRGKSIHMDKSISGFTASNKASLNVSLTPLSISREKADINRSAVGIAAAKMMAVEDSTSIVMIAKEVKGNVTTLFDLKSAIGFGAIFGGIVGLLSLFRRR